jgi:hypothetical protein
LKMSDVIGSSRLCSQVATDRDHRNQQWLTCS